MAGLPQYSGHSAESPSKGPPHLRTDRTAYPGDPMMFDLISSHRVRRGLALAMAPLPLIAMSGCAAVMASLVKAERTESRSFAVAARPAAVVDTFNGEIKVERTSDNKVDAVVTKVGSGANPQAAEKDLENVKVEFSQEGDTV